MECNTMILPVDEGCDDLKTLEYGDRSTAGGIEGQRYLQLPKHGLVLVHTESVVLCTLMQVVVQAEQPSDCVFA